jgi:hypothetical protein
MFFSSAASPRSIVVRVDVLGIAGAHSAASQVIHNVIARLAKKFSRMAAGKHLYLGIGLGQLNAWAVLDLPGLETLFDGSLSRKIAA